MILKLKKIDIITILLIMLLVVSAVSIGLIAKNHQIKEEMSLELEDNVTTISDMHNKILDLGKQIEFLESEVERLEVEYDELKRSMVLLGTFEATAYTDDVESQGKWVGETASGMKPQVGVVAVDPKVIPLGTELFVEGYGNAIAGDVGGAIKGNRVDLFMETRENCMEFGRQNVKVWIIK